MATPEHSKIINKVARKSFKELGIIRKGQSRMWLDDHEWFTTIIEFQPFSGRQGTCLNIGVNFHWYLKDYWSFDIGYRESDFIEFQNEEQFFTALEKLMKIAVNKCLEIRNNLKTLEKAQETIINHKFNSENLWGNYSKAIISGLIGNLEDTLKYFDKLSATEDNTPWAKELKERVESLKKHMDNKETFKESIKQIITETRGLKKLKEINILLN